MTDAQTTRVAVNGCGVIGKRVAAAVTLQEDMSLAGVPDVVTDWRTDMVIRDGFSLFGATGEHVEHVGAMRAANLNVTGTLDELLDQADVVVDCTPKHIAAKNVEVYHAAVEIHSAGRRETQCDHACRATPRPSCAR